MACCAMPGGVRVAGMKLVPVYSITDACTSGLTSIVGIRYNGYRAMKDDLDAYMPLSPATLHLLLALAGEDLHGYGIMQEVLRQSEGRYKLGPDRKSTRLNSSHLGISYAVFCL